MKILTGIDAPFIPFGGSFLCCDDWYSNLPKDVEVRFLTLPPPPNQEKWWSIRNVIMLDIEKARTSEGFMDYVKKLKELIEEEIKDFKPDVIHCQHLNYGLSRAFAEIETTIPRIGICHGTDVQTATNSPFFKENLIKICDKMDLLLFPNQSMADDFFMVYEKTRPYAINALGIPDRFFDEGHSSPLMKVDRPLNLLYAGRLTPWKGADIAVESMYYIKKPAYLTVIGNEDQMGYRQTMLDFVKMHNLQDRVKFEAQLPREKLLARFADYDAIIFPSRRLEAFSLTVVEAQAKGLPLIYFPGGGITDTVGDGGISLRENTPRSLAMTIEMVSAHPELLAKAQQAGYENAKAYKTSLSANNLFSISRKMLLHLRVN